MLYTAIESEKWGYIDKNGEFSICPQFDFASEFAMNRALVCYDDKSAVIDENGNEVLSVKNNPIFLSNDGKIIMKEELSTTIDSLYSIFDSNGKLLFTHQCLDFGGFGCGMARVLIDSHKKYDVLYGFMNEHGIYSISPTPFLSLENFSENLACFCVKRNGRSFYGFIDPTGKRVIPPLYAFVSNFNMGLAPVKYNANDSVVLYIDKNNSTILKLDIDHGYRFSDDGFAKVKKGNKYGFIDKKGNQIIQCQYIEASNFQEKQCVVKDSNGYFGVINHNGNIVIEPAYKAIGDFNNGFAKAIIEKKSTIWGPIKRNILELSYITPFGKVAWKTEINMGNWNTEKAMYNWVKK